MYEVATDSHHARADVIDCGPQQCSYLPPRVQVRLRLDSNRRFPHRRRINDPSRPVPPKSAKHKESVGSCETRLKTFPPANYARHKSPARRPARGQHIKCNYSSKVAVNGFRVGEIVVLHELPCCLWCVVVAVVRMDNTFFLLLMTNGDHFDSVATMLCCNLGNYAAADVVVAVAGGSGDAGLVLIVSVLSTFPLGSPVLGRFSPDEDDDHLIF